MKNCTIFCIILISTLVALPTNEQAHRPAETVVHNINAIELWISNYGTIGTLFYPKGSGHYYLYGAAIWFGIIDSLGDTLVTIGYGPHGGETEFLPGLADQDPDDPAAKIYIYPFSWPAPHAIFPMAPQDTFSHQDSWCCYNDTDINAHIPGDTRPIGIEVYQTGYAWQLSGLQTVIYLIWTVKNITGDTLKNCIFSFCADPDIGDESGTGNDLMAGIIAQEFIINSETLFVDNFVYVWQAEPEPFPAPPWWAAAIGCDFLQSPWDLQVGADKDDDGILDQYEMDSVYFYNMLPDSLWDIDHDATPDWRDPNQIPQVGLTSLKRFTLNLEPNRDNERYMTMAGYNYKIGTYEPYDTAASMPDDQRFLMSAGQFELAPDSIATITIALMLVEWDSLQQRPDTAFAHLDHYCQYIYDINWLLPQAPPPPRLSCIPGDAQITLSWDNFSEITPDPYYAFVLDPGGWIYDPYYREYDFEGYGIWKSSTGASNDWQLIDRCDLFNNITFADTAQPESIRIYADNSGLVHTYIDNDVRNGFTYYYAVTAFDYNFIECDDTLGPGYRELIFEGCKTPVSTTPRRDPANYIPGTCSLEIIYGNDRLQDNITCNIAHPFAMDESIFYVHLSPVTFKSGYENDSVSIPSLYNAYIENANQTAIDSIDIETDNQAVDVDHAFPSFNGITAKINFRRDSLPANRSIFESIEVHGSYPESLVIPSLPGPWTSYFAFWAYRGNDYRIEWYSTTGNPTNANSVRVIDLMTGEEIAYSPYDPDLNHLYDEYASGWCFLSHLEVSDTLILYGTPPATHNTKYLYINGGLIGLNKGGPIMPGYVLPSISDLWTVNADTGFAPAPANALFKIHSFPAYFDSARKISLNIKVVPNPYIGFNEWEIKRFPPKLKFINLPHKCTIRIFNLNGELVKTLLHTHTYEPELGHERMPNDAGGDEWWDLLNNERQAAANGVYIFHVRSDVGEQVGKMVIIR
ncbi:MAG: hypothetical protein WBB37_01740 [bacterium]